MGAAIRLSTYDNPINPFEDFARWYWWDTVVLHYNTCEVLDSEAKTSDQFSMAENRAEIERAIDDIIAHDATGMRCKVVEGQPLPVLKRKEPPLKEEVPPKSKKNEQEQLLELPKAEKTAVEPLNLLNKS